MNLIGWDYTGRNIGPELHTQFKTMVDCLSDQNFTNHSCWGNPIQERLVLPMGVTSSGAVRTVKRMCTYFGFLNQDAISSRKEISNLDLLTERGQVVYYAAKLEQQIEADTTLDNAKKDKALKHIKKIYEEAYCDALKSCYLQNNDGTKLHPLRATLRTLQRNGKLDKWEWYLMNTFIRRDDDKQAEEQLDMYIAKYREGVFQFSMDDVKEKPKGHQYIPQHFEFAGLLHVVQRPDWSISNSDRHIEVKKDVLEANYLNRLYGGNANE